MLLRLTVLLAAFVLPSFADSPATAPADPAPKLPALKTAATLEELKKIEPLVAGESTLRVAIQAETIPFGQGLLLYALWDGQGPDLRGVSSDGDELHLGAFVVKTTRVYQPGEKMELGNLIKPNSPTSRLKTGRTGEALFLAAVIPPSPGTYEVTLSAAKGGPITRNTIVCQKPRDPVHPFYALSATGKDAAFRPAVRALPNWNDELFDPPPKSLPVFLPADADSAFKASLADGQITLAANQSLEQRIEEHALIRIWVNGKASELVREAADRDGKLLDRLERIGSQKVSFRLSLDPADYGASPGDTVEVQFLFAAHGHQRAPSSKVFHRLKPQAYDHQAGASPVLLSNRLTLFAPAK